MSIRSLLKSTLKSAARRTLAALLPPAQIDPSVVRSNQEALAASIARNPRPLRRYEAQALMLLAANGGRYRQQARAALWLAAKAAGRNIGPTPTLEPRLCKASTARLAFWATDRGTPV